MGKVLVTSFCAALLSLCLYPAGASGEIEKVCVENCGGGSKGQGSSQQWQGGSESYSSQPSENHGEKTERLRQTGRSRWLDKAGGRRQDWSSQMGQFRSLSREGEALVKNSAAAGPVEDKNTSLFGIKSGVGRHNTGIPKKAPDGDRRLLKTEKERLACAAKIAGSLLRQLKNQTDTDLVEASFLAEEGLSALQGSTREAECPPLQEGSWPDGDLQGQTTAIKGVLVDTSRQVQAIDQAEMALPTLERERARQEQDAKDRDEKDKELKKEIADRQRDKSKGREKGKAPAKEPDAELARIIKEQQENTAAKEAALAALREIQRVMNEEKARKHEAFGKAEEIRLQAVRAGVKELPR